MNEVLPKLDRGPFPLLPVVSLLVLGVVLLGTFWSFYRSYRLNVDLNSLASRLESTQQQLDELKAQKLASIIVAQKSAEQVKTSIVWSKVVQHLLKLTPFDIFYQSYSASSDAKMSVSVVADSYLSAANLISILNESDVFSNAFVSSLNRGVSEAGQAIVTFGITFNVHPANLSSL